MQSLNPKNKTRVRLLAGAAVATVMGLAVVTALPTLSPADTMPQATAPGNAPSRGWARSAVAAMTECVTTLRNNCEKSGRDAPRRAIIRRRAA